jgi:hypothetical protein
MSDLCVMITVQCLTEHSLFSQEGMNESLLLNENLPLLLNSQSPRRGADF